MPDSDTTSTDLGGSASVFLGEERLLDDASVPDVTDSSLAPPTREGLPPTYHMRATAHYVDLLASGRDREQDQMLDPREIECKEPVDAVSLAPLTESIKAHGVLQPLLVQGHNGAYQLIDGAARLHASLAVGVQKMPCVIYVTVR